MLFLPFYLDCLPQASYLIGDETAGQAVVVDPRRDVVDYLETALAHDLSVVGVINTHFHTDFVSGHLELAGATGAWIGYGPGARAEYPLRGLEDGERIQLGWPEGTVLEILHTPGHTPESISVLVYEHAADPVPIGVLVGDTLSPEGVGCPDVAASDGLSIEGLGAMLHRSVDRLMRLPDRVPGFPAHLARARRGDRPPHGQQATIGEYRVFNEACQPMSQPQFVTIVSTDLSPTLAHLDHVARRNRQAAQPWQQAPVPAMSFGEAWTAHDEGRSFSMTATATATHAGTYGGRSASRSGVRAPRPSGSCSRTIERSSSLHLPII